MSADVPAPSRTQGGSAITDRATIRLVTFSLGLVAVIGLIGMMVLAGFDKDIPDAVSNLTSAAIGAIAALLARTSAEPPANVN